MTVAKSILMYHGHDPRLVDEYPWHDVEAFLTMLPYLEQTFGGF